jgi:hypothetical protein
LKWLKLLAPPFVPLVFWATYMPVNAGWTVHRFGCGCHRGFNANSFNSILFWLVMAISLGLAVWASLALKGWRRIVYLACGIPFQGAVSWVFWARSLWR